MSECFLAIKNVKIHNANAMSSGYTIGVPAMTAWLGTMHALQRQLRQRNFKDIFLQKIVVSCHTCDLQVYRGAHDYRYSIIGTANPSDNKDGSARPAFVEEPRCHLLVSMLIEVNHFNPDDRDELLEAVKTCFYVMKIAGGDIENQTIDVKFINNNDNEIFRKEVNRLLMPGFVLVERQDLFQEVTGKDNLDVLLRFLSVKVSVERNEKDEITNYSRNKLLPNHNWLVPAVVGFKDLTGPINVANQRSNDYNHHFVEPIVTIGEYIMPYQCQNINSLMWYYDYDEINGLYLCKNDYSVDIKGEEVNYGQEK